MTPGRCAIIYTNGNGRSPGTAVAGRGREPGSQADADMTADSLAAISHNAARLKRRASLIPASQGITARLKFTGPCGLADTKAKGGGATTDRNDKFAEIHL